MFRHTEKKKHNRATTTLMIIFSNGFVNKVSENVKNAHYNFLEPKLVSDLITFMTNKIVFYHI